MPSRDLRFEPSPEGGWGGARRTLEGVVLRDSDDDRDQDQDVTAMVTLRIVKRPRPPRVPDPLDLRTPSGRPLPY